MRLILFAGAASAVACLSAGTATGAREPHCGIKLKPGAESHAILFRTTCNFQQTSIRFNPDEQVVGVKHHATVGGNADPDDAMACHRRELGERARCDGRAGKGARVRGLFETPAFSCDVTANVRILGGPDCSGDVCPAVLYTIRKQDLSPTGCA